MSDWSRCRLTIHLAHPLLLDEIEAVVRRHGPSAPPRLHWSELIAKRWRVAVSQALGLRALREVPHAPLLLEYLCPMPEPLRLEAERSEGRGWTVEPAWRKWRVDNWNAAYEPDRIDWTRPGREQLSLRFETPWSPPLAAIRTGALRLGFTFRLTFCTGESVGWATIDEEKYLNYSHDAPPAEQGLPQELIDDFDLLAIYQSAKAGEI